MSSVFPPALEERYEPLGLLGKGGMGTVFRARDRELGREVAIKVLHMKLEGTVGERFRREAEALAELKHPHILQVFDHGTTPDGPYIVMELLEGRDLGVVPPDLEPLDALLPIAEALEVVHGAGLVHRDVKPANILRTRDGRCVLMDFGLIFVDGRTALTETGAVSGTITYLSPETMQMAGPPAPPADWWALGVTLFALYENELPYDMDQVMRFATHQEVPAPPLSRLDPSSREGRAVLALLEADPARRPGSRAAIEAAAEGRWPPDAVPAPELVSEPRRSRGSLALASAAVMAGIVGGVLRARDATVPTPPPASSVLRPAGAPRDLPVPRFGEEFLELARRDLRAAEQLAMARDWRIVPRASPEAWIGLTDLDPLVWGALWGELEHVVDFHAWLAHGGRPEELDATSREVLHQVDELHRGQLLPEPFAPLLAGPPERPVPLPETFVVIADDHPPLRPAYGGWLGAAFQAHRNLKAFERFLQADVDASVEGRPTSEDFPRTQGLATTVWRSKLSSLVETYFLKGEDRLALRRWFGEGAAHLRRLLYCAGRALRPGEPDRDLALALLDSLLTRSDLYQSEFAHMDPALALGLAPQDRATRLAFLAFQSRNTEVFHRAGLPPDPPVGELLRQAELEAAAMDLSAPMGNYHWSLSFRIQLRLATREGTHDALTRLLDRSRDRLDAAGLPRLRVRAAALGFALWEQLDDKVPFDRDLRTWITTVLLENPDLVEASNLRSRVPLTNLALRARGN